MGSNHTLRPSQGGTVTRAAPCRAPLRRWEWRAVEHEQGAPSFRTRTAAWDPGGPSLATCLSAQSGRFDRRPAMTAICPSGRLESTSSGHASGHSSRSTCDGGCQIRFSSVCANATARSSGMRPITRRLRPPRDHQASDRLSRRSERIVPSGASLAMMQRATGAPEGST
jgi:hypothetical protein